MTLPDFPFPEALPTIDAQLALLRQGRKPAVYVPHWSPELASVSDFPAEITPAGTIFYDPARLPPDRIHAAVALGRLGTILGYGIPSKPAKPDRAVSLLAGEIEVASVLADEATEPAVRSALGLFANTGDEIRTEAPIEVTRRRLRWWTNYVKA